MPDNQSPPPSLSPREQKKLRQEQAQQRDARQRLVRRTVIGVLLVAVIAFIGWWGIRADRQHKRAVAAANIGGVAPDFNLPATTGETIRLSDFRGNKNVLIYFHEGLSCDPCIQQMPELEKSLEEFDKLNVAVISVAFDPVDKLKEAAQQYNMKTPVLSYQTAQTEVDYDLLRFSMDMGRRAGHTFVLVGTNGAVKWRKDYWPGRGHMVPGGRMFVESSEIVSEVSQALGQ